MSEATLIDTVDSQEIDELPQDLFLLGLLRAHAEKKGLSKRVLSAQFDPLATQLLMLIDGAPSSDQAPAAMN